jgi:hypothetical protein
LCQVTTHLVENGAEAGLFLRKAPLQAAAADPQPGGYALDRRRASRQLAPEQPSDRVDAGAVPRKLIQQVLSMAFDECPERSVRRLRGDGEVRLPHDKGVPHLAEAHLTAEDSPVLVLLGGWGVTQRDNGRVPVARADPPEPEHGAGEGELGCVARHLQGRVTLQATVDA